MEHITLCNRPTFRCIFCARVGVFSGGDTWRIWPCWEGISFMSASTLSQAATACQACSGKSWQWGKGIVFIHRYHHHHCLFRHQQQSWMSTIKRWKEKKHRTLKYFRGIAITPILSKIFEYCFSDKFQYTLRTGDNQFGFKKGRGCTHAIYACRKIIDQFVNSGSTVNLCTLDLSN